MIASKAFLFGVPMLLTLGTGIGVAYHDGVMADDVQSTSDASTGDSVAFKGRVIARDEECKDGDKKLGKDVSCFALRDLDDDTSFALVSDDSDPPQVDDVVVVRGILKFRYKMDGGSGSTSWEGACWNAGSYGGSGCTSGGSAAWSWPGFELAWVDASSVAEPWIFR